MAGLGVCPECKQVVSGVTARPTVTGQDDAGWLTIEEIEITYWPCRHQRNRTFNTTGESDSNGTS
jgi:hypothetical protein